MPSETKSTRSLPAVLRTYFFGGVYAILAAELFLRIYAPVPMLPRYIMGSDLGIRVNMPSQHYVHRTPDYRVDIKTNSKGVRADREIPYEKPPGVKRIVALGDSFMMGYGATLEQMALSVIAQELEAAGHRVEVINLSVSGFGNSEHLLYLEAEGLKYQPDLVLLGWHDTDLVDNVRSRLYRLEDGELVRQDASYLPGVKIREFLFQFSAYRFLAGNSQLYNWLRDRAGALVKDLLAQVRLAASAPETSAEPVVSEPLPEAQGAVPYPDLLTLALLDRIVEVSQADGANFMILEIPVRFSRTKFGSRFPETAVNADYNRVNPIHRFNEYEGELIYWERSHGHFTPLGNRIAAEEAAKLILERRLLD